MSTEAEFAEAMASATRIILAAMRKRDVTPMDGDHLSLADITNGWCESWAYEVLKLIEDAEGGWTEEFDKDVNVGHYVVKWHGKYYDAECPEGTEDMTLLPYYGRFR